MYSTHNDRLRAAGSGPQRQPQYVDDVGALYREHSRRLERIVRHDVRAPEVVIEDACQSAWIRLLHHATEVRHEAALSWLATTAVREAVRLARRADRDVSLDAAEGWIGRATVPGADSLAEQRERLAELEALPLRQQRMVWLHALGLTYNEIAVETACTVRTVERQLLRAKRALRAAPAPERTTRGPLRAAPARQ